MVVPQACLRNRAWSIVYATCSGTGDRPVAGGSNGDSCLEDGLLCATLLIGIVVDDDPDDLLFGFLEMRSGRVYTWSTMKFGQ